MVLPAPAPTPKKMMALAPAIILAARQLRKKRRAVKRLGAWGGPTQMDRAMLPLVIATEHLYNNHGRPANPPPAHRKRALMKSSKQVGQTPTRKVTSIKTLPITIPPLAVRPIRTALHQKTPGGQTPTRQVNSTKTPLLPASPIKTPLLATDSRGTPDVNQRR